jgi:hypothetical protein
VEGLIFCPKKKNRIRRRIIKESLRKIYYTLISFEKQGIQISSAFSVAIILVVVAER